jgi:hypothetical protein
MADPEAAKITLEGLIEETIRRDMEIGGPILRALIRCLEREASRRGKSLFGEAQVQWQFPQGQVKD